ncbi:hypothetical protein AAZX31_16G083400 [Glycine max]|uniref:Transmembrane protein n=2 Tax=Glycine subgen. Soja TaxID=1462606 RepID=K7MG36_SOYBN|nr:hypothetical protein JHK86_044843 [Glycine max]KAG4940822.1 hypothetical protein JHK87_044693 [Glycine soja]KAG4951591.1 hypothetical protein JHK85_045458 [Glycine max]KAG5099445.1 hypothetical protein JHK82_044497 [Glycine max]KAG5108047.1 hypothetical protein JHK84_044954 [Glycine max]
MAKYTAALLLLVLLVVAILNGSDASRRRLPEKDDLVYESQIFGFIPIFLHWKFCLLHPLLCLWRPKDHHVSAEIENLSIAPTNP